MWHQQFVTLCSWSKCDCLAVHPTEDESSFGVVREMGKLDGEVFFEWRVQHTGHVVCGISVELE